jgi:GNAT superfamily N-acetyltransferase
VADELVPWEHGTVLRTPSCADYWDYNAVRLEGPAPGLDAADVLARVDELQAELRHRKLEIEDEATGARLRPDLLVAGWMGERLAFMRRDGPPPPGHPQVEEVPYEATRALRIEWHSDVARDPAEVERFARLQEPIVARRSMRAFVVRRDGRPVAFSTVDAPPDADAVEVDQLYVTPPARGLGLGRMLLEAALAAGGRDVAWIVADDEDWPKALYARAGFKAVWRQYAMLRMPVS